MLEPGTLLLTKKCICSTHTTLGTNKKTCSRVCPFPSNVTVFGHMKQGQTVLSVPSKYLLPPWHNSKLLFFQAIMLLDFSLPGQLFHIERFVDWGDLEIAYFEWHAQSGHRAITKISRYWVQAGYRQGIDQLWSSFGLYPFVSYLKIALAHAHTDCNSPRALVAAPPGGVGVL